MALTHLYYLPVITLFLCIVPYRCSYYYCPQLPSLHHDGNEAVIAQPYHYVYIPTGNAFYLNSSFPTGTQHGTLCVNQIIEGVNEVIKCTRYIPSLGQSNLDDNFRLSERNGYYMLFVKSLKPYQNKVKYIWWMYGTNDVVTHTTVESIDTDSKPWQITAENDVTVSVYGRLFHTKATEITLMNATSNTPLTSAWLTDGDAYRCHLWKDELEGDIALAANNDYFLIVFNMSCVVSGRYVLITTLEKDEAEKIDINVIVQGKQSANVVILEHPSNYGDTALIQCNVSSEIHGEPRWTLNQKRLQINGKSYLYPGPGKTLRFDSFHLEYQGSYSCIIEEDCYIIESQPITLAVTSAVDPSQLTSPHPLNNNTAGTHSGKEDTNVLIGVLVSVIAGVLGILAIIAIYRCLKDGGNVKLCRRDYQRQQQEEPQVGGNVDEEEEMNDVENVRFSHPIQEQSFVVYRKPSVVKVAVEADSYTSPNSDNGPKEGVVEEDAIASPLQDSDTQVQGNSKLKVRKTSVDRRKFLEEGYQNIQSPEVALVNVNVNVKVDGKGNNNEKQPTKEESQDSVDGPNKSLIDPFLNFLLELSDDIRDGELNKLKHVLQMSVPKGIAEAITEPYALFNKMVELGVLKQTDTKVLEEALTKIGRKDLADRLSTWK
ncbi:uncharacterized protein LOC144440138 isoform X2 [Glandiceps talaboti]